MWRTRFEEQRMRRQFLSLVMLLAAAGPVAASEGGASTAPDQQQAAAVSGLAAEIGAALGPAGAKPSNADRDALAKFYEARQYEPVWVSSSGLGPAGRAIAAELAKADDWGLEASAFRLPTIPTTGAELSRADRAKFDVCDQFRRAENTLAMPAAAAWTRPRSASSSTASRPLPIRTS
jgi:hypothetical protein